MAYPQYIKDMASYIEKAVLDKRLFTVTENYKTHLSKHEAERDKRDVLDRVFKDNGRQERDSFSNKESKNINSGFYSKEAGERAIEECVMKNSLQIAQWVDGARSSEKKSFSFDVRLPKEQGYDPVGYGYAIDQKTNTIDEYETNVVRIVLQKDINFPLGFTMVTAYPDIIRDENRTPTGKDLTDITKETETYKQASPAARAYMLYQTGKNKPYLATFKEGYNGDTHDDVMSIHIPFTTKKGNERKHIIRIKQDSVEVSTSALMDVKVSKYKDPYTNRYREKVIYPGEDQDAIVQDQIKKGRTVTDDRRYVKIDTILTRKFLPPDHKGKSIDLTRDDVFTEFQSRFPRAADIVSRSCDVLDTRKPRVLSPEERLNDRNEKISAEKDVEKSVKKPEAKLDESLMPIETDQAETNYAMSC